MFTRIVVDQAQVIKNMKKATELVFIPAPPVGHLASAVELAKLLVSRDDHLFITIIIMKLPYDSKTTDFLIDSSAAAASDHIKFIVLKKPDVDFTNMNRNTFRKLFVESHKSQVRDVVAGLAECLSESTPRVLAGFIVDMICPTMIDVANEFGVPTYLFFPSNAAFLGVMLHHQTITDEHGLDIIDFKGSDSELVLPGFVKPLPSRALPSVLLEKEAASSFANYARRYRETKGILVNTFSELEPHAVRALSGSYGKVPPVYPVGPILKLNSDDDNRLVEFDDHVRQKSDVLNWLDDQLPSSVVFLCFGSMGSFGLDQVKEIATALEHSGHRFLWSLRRPPCKGKIAPPSEYEDFVGVLPDGFLPRTAKIGKVIGWAPQVAVLAHPAVGGFVSHCGWNSILESLWFGVPIATWPMYAEQQMNAFEMVRELGLAVETSIHYSKDCFGSCDENQMMILRAEEIERGIREVMEKDCDVRKRVKEMSEVSKKALTDGGSSYSSLGRFLDQILL